MIIASEDFIKEVGSIKPEQWKKITETLKVVKGFMDVDEGVLEGMNQSIKDTIDLQLESLLSEMTNTVNAAITEIITPFLTDILQPMINSLNTFLGENTFGAGVGGIVGSIVSMFVPGGVLWVALGSIIGALWEEGAEEYSPEARMARFFDWTPPPFLGANRIEDFLAWLNGSNRNTYLPGLPYYRGGR